MSDAYHEQIGGKLRGEQNPKVAKQDRRTRWKEGQAFPDGWLADGYAYRKSRGLPRRNLELEPDRFINHALQTGRLCANWRRAWLNWLISEFLKAPLEAEPKEVCLKPSPQFTELPTAEEEAKKIAQRQAMGERLGELAKMLRGEVPFRR